MSGAQSDHSSHADNHGQTPAAWAAVIIATLGFLVGAYAVLVSLIWLFWVAVGIVVLGGIAGWALKVMGFGQDSTPAHPAGR